MSLTAAPPISYADHATQQIRAAIRDGRYPPETPLVERRLAAELGVSHIPVREALARLVEEGLVTQRPHRSAVVADLTDRQLDEFTSLRINLEQFVVARAQERLTDRDVEEFNNLIRLMERAAERGNVRQVAAYDRRFHERLWELADHDLVMGVANQLRSRVDGFLIAVLSSLDTDGLQRQARTHRQLLQAIAGSDLDAAHAAVAEHITVAARAIRHRTADGNEMEESAGVLNREAASVG